jgi:hypothetical protein
MQSQGPGVGAALKTVPWIRAELSPRWNNASSNRLSNEASTTQARQISILRWLKLAEAAGESNGGS